MNFWHWLTGRAAVPPPYVTDDSDEATESKQRARAALNHTQAQAPDVEAVASSLRRIRQENHFGEDIYRAMLRKEPRQ